MNVIRELQERHATEEQVEGEDNRRWKEMAAALPPVGVVVSFTE